MKGKVEDEFVRGVWRSTYPLSDSEVRIEGKRGEYSNRVMRNWTSAATYPMSIPPMTTLP
jgi:hypothetical protein